jgi:hypothetical protein
VKATVCCRCHKGPRQGVHPEVHPETHALAEAIAASMGSSTITVRKGWYQPKVRIARMFRPEAGWFVVTLFRDSAGAHTVHFEINGVDEGDARTIIEAIFPKKRLRQRRRRGKRSV